MEKGLLFYPVLRQFCVTDGSVFFFSKEEHNLKKVDPSSEKESNGHFFDRYIGSPLIIETPQNQTQKH